MPAKAGIQSTNLDSRFHGNDARPVIPLGACSIGQPAHRRDLA